MPRTLIVVVTMLVALLSACSSSGETATAVVIEPKGGAEVEELLAGTALDGAPSIPAVPAGRGEGIDGQAGADGSEDPGGVELPSGPPSRDGSSLADQIESVGPVARLDDLTVPGDGGPVPVSIDLPSIGVAGAPIVDVGVEPNGEMEIPGATDVGWYRFGPNPGAAGSSVLAAHIAFDGVDGVFRDLIDVEPGDRFGVEFDDGSRERFVVIGLRQWSKLDIPLEDLFARDGTPRLVLITCGGSFNPQLSSYDDNIVVIAVPLDFALG